MIGNLPFTFDRAREIKRVRLAGRLALRGVKSAGQFAGGVAMLAIGGFSALTGLHGVRLPDSVLLQKAIASAAIPPPPPSALDERDMFIMMAVVGVLVLACAVFWLNEWWKNPTAKPAAKLGG